MTEEEVKQPSPKPEHGGDDDTPSAVSLSRQRPGTPSLLYQLRRVGAAASMKGVKDVFKLTKPRTIIGRNSSEVDCFVDSSIHTKLISRQHAEILMEMDENQSPILHVLDKSLNGTFVNDIKVSSQTKVPLREGDTLTLGHLRGVQVKQGTYAEQLNSEFRFRLVYAPVEEDLTEEDENTPTKRKKKESPKVSKKTRILYPPDSNVSSPTSQSATKAVNAPPFLQQNNVHGAETESGVNATSTRRGKTSSRVDSKSTPSNQDSDNKTLDVGEDEQPTLNSDLWRGKPKRGRGKATTRGSSRGRGAARGLGQGRGSTRGLGRGRGRGRGQGDHERMETEETVDLSEETGHAVSKSNEAADEFQFEFESESGNEEDTALHQQVDEICQRSFENSDSDSGKSKPGPSRLVSARVKISKYSGSTKIETKGTDKKKGDSTSSAQGLRKRRAAATKKDDITEYNSQPCSSSKCCRPKDSTVTWVQCDDCDNWYHVTCVGCDYDKVKQDDYQFYCGCKPKSSKK